MKTLTGSSSAAGLVFFVFALASLAAPLGGLVVDRLPKRPLMIVTHVALAGVMCLLLFVHDRGDVWLLYAVTALYGLGGDIFGAARSAMLKSMLPDELLADANGALPVGARGPAARRAARGRRHLRRVRRPGRRAGRRRDVSRLCRDARRAAFSRAAAGAEGAPLPARAVRRHHPHRAHACAPAAQRGRRCGPARDRLRRDDHLRRQQPEPPSVAVVHRRADVVPGRRRRGSGASRPRHF